MPDTIDMIRCPHCDEEWIRSSDELVCDNCAPQYAVDIAIQQIEEAVVLLEGSPSKVFKDRIGIVNNLAHRMYAVCLKTSKALKDE